MKQCIYDFVATAKQEIGKVPNILEIGSLDVNGSVREIFNDALEYTGIDIVKGDGVDMIVNAHELDKHFEVNHYDVILCLEMLEHDPEFWKTLEQAKTVLKIGGHLIVSAPFMGGIHGYPSDFYRFTAQALAGVVFRDMEILLIKTVGDAVMGYAKKCYHE